MRNTFSVNGSRLLDRGLNFLKLGRRKKIGTRVNSCDGNRVVLVAYEKSIFSLSPSKKE